MKYFFYAVLFLFLSCRHQKSTTATLPDCLSKKIEEFKKLGKKYRPTHITSYTYKEKTVYYIPSRCCDQMSEVYDESCNLICQPEGGITGKGDGKCKDLVSERKDPKVVWTDEVE